MQMILCNSARMGGVNDKNVIRIPAHIRTLNSIDLDSMLVFRTKTNEHIALKVKQAFLSDLNLNGEASFVSDEILQKLDLAHLEVKINPIASPEITLGCDPEFFITTSTGGIVSAGAFFSKQGPVGHDGILCELRPFPSKDPREVTEKLRSLLFKVRNVIPPDLKMIASSCLNGLTAGFHVHLGIPQALLMGTLTPYILGYLTRILDFYVGIPATQSEYGNECLRRTSIGVQYGKVGDFRSSLRTLEYRVPGGSMLKSPEFAEGLLALSKVVARDAIGRLLAQTKQLSDINMLPYLDTSTREMYPNIPIGGELKQLVEGNDIQGLRRAIKIIQADVRYMYEYNKYALPIEKLFDVLQTNPGNDITLNWLT